MTRDNISALIGNISDRYIEEAASFTAKKKRISFATFGALAASLCIVAAVGIYAWSVDLFGLGGEEDTHSYYTQTSDGGPTGGELGSYSISKSAAVVVGNAITDAEIDEYIKNNKSYIIHAVEKEYDIEIETISIYSKGFSHVSLGKTNEVRLNAITLPVLVNGKMYASVSMVKEGDELVSTINIGGDKWENYNSTLSCGDEVVFAYLPDAMGEIMIMPDNTYVDPVVGAEPSVFYDKDTDFYSLFKTEHNILSAKDLVNTDNLVKLYTNE